MAQLLASEDVLGTKDNEIHAFQQRVKDYDSLQKQLVQQQEEIEALQAQVVEPVQSLLCHSELNVFIFYACHKMEPVVLCSF